MPHREGEVNLVDEITKVNKNNLNPSLLPTVKSLSPSKDIDEIVFHLHNSFKALQNGTEKSSSGQDKTSDYICGDHTTNNGQVETPVRAVNGRCYKRGSVDLKGAPCVCNGALEDHRLDSWEPSALVYTLQDPSILKAVQEFNYRTSYDAMDKPKKIYKVVLTGGKCIINILLLVRESIMHVKPSCHAINNVCFNAITSFPWLLI